MTEIIHRKPGDKDIQEDPVVKIESRKFLSKHWCPDCGNQFKGEFTVSGILRSSGNGEMHMEGCTCPDCGSKNTSPHVHPGSISTSAPELLHIAAAVRFALDLNHQTETGTDGPSPRGNNKFAVLLRRLKINS